MTTKTILVPCYISNKEKQGYIKEYLEDGYKIKSVYDYDVDNDVYILEKIEEKIILIPNYIDEDQKEKYLKPYKQQGYKIKNIYEHDLDNDAYVLVK